MSIVTFEKPLPHISIADWYAKQWEHQQTNATRNKDAFNLRHETRQLTNETRVKSEWDTYLNNARLTDRLIELNKWRDILKSSLDRINQEILNLKKAKFEGEKDIDSLGTRFAVISECLSMRDCRQGAELTYDESDTELKKEFCLTEGVKRHLIERSQAVWEKINKLEELKFQLTLDLNDKTEAAELDHEQLVLNKQSATITYKINSTRIPKNSVTYEVWLEHTKQLKQLADNELADTLKLSESYFVVRERSKNDMISQRDYVDFAIRKQIFETQKSRNESQWQEKIMRESLEKLGGEIQSLEMAIIDKKNALKLAKTRLENRSYRPGFELALDEPDQGLKKEVVELLRCIQDLINKLNCIKSTVSTLEEQLVVIDRDIENKNQSLMTDIRCLDLRKRLRTEEPISNIERNIKLVAMEEEMPQA